MQHKRPDFVQGTLERNQLADHVHPVCPALDHADHPLCVSFEAPQPAQDISLAVHSDLASWRGESYPCRRPPPAGPGGSSPLPPKPPGPPTGRPPCASPPPPLP